MARVTIDTSGFARLATQAGNLATSSEALAKRVRNILNSTDTGTLKRSSADKDLNSVYSKLLKQKNVMSAFKKECGTSATAYDKVTNNVKARIKNVPVAGPVTGPTHYVPMCPTPQELLLGGVIAVPSAEVVFGLPKQPWYGYTPIPPGTLGDGNNSLGTIIDGAFDVADYVKEGSGLYDTVAEYGEYFDIIKLPSNRLDGVVGALSYVLDSKKLVEAIKEGDGEAFNQLLEKYGTKVIGDAIGKVSGAAGLEVKAFAKLIWNYAENGGEILFSGGGSGNLFVDTYDLFIHPITETGMETAWDIVTGVGKLGGFSYEEWSGYDTPDDAMEAIGGVFNDGLNYWGESIKEKGLGDAIRDNVSTTVDTFADIGADMVDGAVELAGNIYEGAKAAGRATGKAVYDSYCFIKDGLKDLF